MSAPNDGKKSMSFIQMSKQRSSSFSHTQSDAEDHPTNEVGNRPSLRRDGMNVNTCPSSVGETGPLPLPFGESTSSQKQVPTNTTARDFTKLKRRHDDIDDASTSPDSSSESSSDKDSVCGDLPIFIKRGNKRQNIRSVAIMDEVTESLKEIALCVGRDAYDMAALQLALPKTPENQRREEAGQPSVEEDEEYARALQNVEYGVYDPNLPVDDDAPEYQDMGDDYLSDTDDDSTDEKNDEK